MNKTITDRRVAAERAKLLKAVAEGEDIHLHLRIDHGGNYTQGLYLTWRVSYRPYSKVCGTGRCILLSELLEVA